MVNADPPTRQLIEGRSALIVIDIQASTFVHQDVRAIDHMPRYAGRMALAPVAIDKARQCDIPVIFLQEVHRPDLVDFRCELDGSEDVRCLEDNPNTAIATREIPARVIEDCVAGSTENAHEYALQAMEYLQRSARRSLARVLEAMDDHQARTPAAVAGDA